MTSKLDHRLVREIQERRQRAEVKEKTTQERASDRYQVTIEFEQALSPRKGKSRTEAISNLKAQAQAHQASVVNALASMGVTDFETLPLSNSIKTSLTIGQIDEIAKHPDVKIVRLVKLEKVTT